ncbi:hypothetical protein AAH145_25090 [Bacteroides thetaiotaomicron]|uniref:hypothetical protein n=1 Tax=Bacteroidaceae TaxID=815 RepID=UPI0039B6DB7E
MCNNYQFEHLLGSYLINILNQKTTGWAVIVRLKESLRICYMVFSIARTNVAREALVGRIVVVTLAMKVLQKRIKISTTPLTKLWKARGG